MSRKSDVLNKTWTITDENDYDIISEDINEGNEINNNTRCLVSNNNNNNNETYLSTTINKIKFDKNNNSLIEDKNNYNTIEIDFDTCFAKVFNINKNNYLNCLNDSMFNLFKRAIDTFDPIENELFIEAYIDDDDLRNEKPLLLPHDLSFANSIPQSFDLFLHDLNRKSIIKENNNQNKLKLINSVIDNDSKRSISEIDLKNLDSISSASTSTTNLLEIKTSSPLKKQSFFSSNENDNFCDNDDEKDKPVFNLTYTSLNTNEEQIEKDFISQNLTTEIKTDEQQNNLNRTFCIDEKKNSSCESVNEINSNTQLISLPRLSNLPVINKNQTILIDEPKIDDQNKYMSLPVNVQNQQEQKNQIKTQTTSNNNNNLNSKIPKFGIPRIIPTRIPSSSLQTPIQSVSSTTSTSASIASSSSSSTTSSSSISANTLTSLPQLAEVKNQNTIKTSNLPSISRKSPLKSQSIAQVQVKPLSTSKENKLNNDGLKRPNSLTKPIQQNEVKISPSSNRIVTGLTKSQNGDTKKVIKQSSMIPSFKPSVTTSKIALPMYNKK